VTGGPLSGLRWPAEAIPSRALLHDDGRRLWVVKLNGRARIVWRHPKVNVAELAVGPGGRSLAYSILAKPHSTKDASAFLYFLRSDGHVLTVDRVNNYETISSLAFLRSPHEHDDAGMPTGPVRLYWVRSFLDTKTPASGEQEQAFVLTEGRLARVDMGLREGEWPNWLAGYPGANVFTLKTFRIADQPTRFEVLLTRDSWNPWRSPHPATELKRWLSITNTDSGLSVAWLSPRDYVVSIRNRWAPQRSALYLYRYGCEYMGGQRIIGGEGIERGLQYTDFPLLPGGPSTVLILRSRDVQGVRQGKRATARWVAVNVNTGRAELTDVRWRPGGWWAYVQPARNPAALALPMTDAGANCAKYHYGIP
jgi:hypothetical protein